MAGQSDWVLLAYRLPREPSNPRVVLWRKLRRLGVVQIVDGLVALPADARTQEGFEWLADEVIEARGEASIWVGRPGSARQERALAARMAEAVTGEYRAVLANAQAALSATPVARRRTLARLRREYRRIAARDFFPPAVRDETRAAIELLAAHEETKATR